MHYVFSTVCDHKNAILWVAPEMIKNVHRIFKSHLKFLKNPKAKGGCLWYQSRVITQLWYTKVLKLENLRPIPRGVWNLPHKFHLYFIVTQNTANKMQKITKPIETKQWKVDKWLKENWHENNQFFYPAVVAQGVNRWQCSHKSSFTAGGSNPAWDVYMVA